MDAPRKTRAKRPKPGANSKVQHWQATRYGIACIILARIQERRPTTKAVPRTTNNLPAACPMAELRWAASSFRPGLSTRIARRSEAKRGEKLLLGRQQRSMAALTGCAEAGIFGSGFEDPQKKLWAQRGVRCARSPTMALGEFRNLGYPKTWPDLLCHSGRREERNSAILGD